VVRRRRQEENCIVTVHIAYARKGFHAVFDGELYLPKSWSDDRERCREAGIPDDMVYRPKWKIGLELYDHATGNGLHFDWMTFDEGYGSKPEFLRELSARNQRFVGEVPRNFMGWIKAPRSSPGRFTSTVAAAAARHLGSPAAARRRGGLTRCSKRTGSATSLG